MSAAGQKNMKRGSPGEGNFLFSSTLHLGYRR
jgi:hypothetical protein